MAAITVSCAPAVPERTIDAAAPVYGEDFWRHWGDGRAELAGYDLTYARYGEARRGTAVTIFVTETFAVEPRVKSEDPRRAREDTFPVLKLNLVQDFPTGIYDYNLMTSAFVALDDSRVSVRGETTKVSFSSQEWCGHVYSQLLFAHGSVTAVSHGYFDGEVDDRAELDPPPDGLAEDSLLLWARGLATPVLVPGESRSVRLLRSLEIARLDHLPLAWEKAELVRAARPTRVRVAAGEFEVDRLEVRVAPTRTSRTYPPAGSPIERPERTWGFDVERAPPHRLIRWERSDGTRAELVRVTRLPYWEMNATGFERALRELGLEPRPGRTP